MGSLESACDAPRARRSETAGEAKGRERPWTPSGLTRRWRAKLAPRAAMAACGPDTNGREEVRSSRAPQKGRGAFRRFVGLLSFWGRATSGRRFGFVAARNAHRRRTHGPATEIRFGRRARRRFTTLMPAWVPLSAGTSAGAGTAPILYYRCFLRALCPVAGERFNRRRSRSNAS